jgi:ribose 5-phosphate isomerase
MKAWLDVDLPSREDGAERLIKSYLAAFGPATQSDLLRFAGMRVADVRPGLERLPLRSFRDERGRLLLDVPRGPLPDGDTPAPVRFLPKWDSSILAYAPPERTRILPEKYRSTVIRKNGDVLPTVLVDGFVAAWWKLVRERGAARLAVEPFERLDHLDIAIDGADQVSPDGWLVKGGGAAHTREKIVAAAADRFVVIADSSKAVAALAPPVPLELLAFGLAATLRALAPVELRDAPRSPDGGVIADYLGDVGDPAALAARLSATPGVVEHGLFPPSIVDRILIARGTDVEIRVDSSHQV